MLVSGLRVIYAVSDGFSRLVATGKGACYA
jgi:hypothetical protein